MTCADLSKILQRITGATPGPWRDAPAVGSGSRVILDGTGYLFAQCDDGQNAEFIAAARTDVPALLAALTEARRVAAQAVAANPSLEVLAAVVRGWSEP